MAQRITIILDRDDFGEYAAHIREFPEAEAQAETIGQAAVSALDALEAVLEHHDIGQLIEDLKKV